MQSFGRAAQTWARRSLPALLPSAAALALAAPAVGHDFQILDDSLYLTDNPHVRAGLSGPGVVWAFTSFHAANWHPLAWLSHMLDVELFGLAPAGHHAVGALLHALNTLLLYALCQRMTGARWRSALVAALFALHPLHVESFAWVSQRRDLLCTAFGLAAMLGWVQFVRSKTRAAYACTLLLFAGSLLSKPMLVSLPALLLLLEWWPLRRPEPLRARLIEKWPLFALSAAACAVTLAAQRTLAVASLQAFPLPVRVSNALVSWATYVGRTLWPVDLAVYYPHPGAAPLAATVGAAALLAAVTVAVARGARRAPFLAVGWLWFLGSLVPVIGLVQVGSQGLADRYMYVPSVGLFLIASFGLGRAAGRVRRGALPATALALGVLLALFATARAQLDHWRDGTHLLSHTLRVTGPNPFALNLMGLALARQGAPLPALAQYQDALALDPTFVPAHINRGAALISLGRLSQGVESYRAALALEPGSARGHYNLGLALVQLGRSDEAETALGEAVRLDPEHARARFHLATVLARRGDLRAAEQQLERALQTDPLFSEARHNLTLARAALDEG